MLHTRKTSISITRATRDHLPQLLSMIRGYAEYQELDHLMTVTKESLQCALFGPRRCAEALLAYYGDECTGFAIFYTTYCGVRGRQGMSISGLFVEPEFRDEGVGIALLRCIAEIASERGYYQAEGFVCKWNDAAINFFYAAGAASQRDRMHICIDEDFLCRLATRHARSVVDTPQYQGDVSDFDCEAGGSR